MKTAGTTTDEIKVFCRHQAQAVVLILGFHVLYLLNTAEVPGAVTDLRKYILDSC